jgi:isoquinoline 1-oxidoreductase beta subunit
MGRLKTFTRRAFLIGSVAVAGGVAFGAYMVNKPHANPLLDDLGEGEAALTPYVRIDADGVTLITPRADKGQGAYSVQAALIAEELDIELDQIRVDPGPPSPAYWNTALADEAAAFMAPGGGIGERIAFGVLSAVMKTIGMQITGGSTTVPDGFVKLRQAGAVARETLKLAAAQKTGASAASELRTRGRPSAAARWHFASPMRNWRRSPPPSSRPRTSSCAIAVRVAADRQADAARRHRRQVHRHQSYGIDHKVEGMVHAAVKLNPRRRDR